MLDFPAWDCQPYDRASPNAGIVSRRMTVLARIARTRSSSDKPRILCTTIDALLQRLPPRKFIETESFSAAPGNAVDMNGLAQWLENNGYLRSSTVRDTGEYAVRGGILDLFPPGMPAPLRLDFFGDTLESIRAFDPETQRTTQQMRALDLVPMSEVQLTTETIRRFRQGYVAAFGAQTRGDTLYEAVSEGRRHAGMEHWLPLYYGGADTLFEFLATRRCCSMPWPTMRWASVSAKFRITTTRARSGRSLIPMRPPTNRCRRTPCTSSPMNGAA